MIMEIMMGMVTVTTIAGFSKLLTMFYVAEQDAKEYELVK